jgi:hypothetical protein
MPVMKYVGAAALLSAAMGSAYAGAPLLSEDAGVIEPGVCEIEVATAHTRVSGASARDQGAGLSCGAGHSWQWSLGLSRATDDVASERGRSVGAKVTLWKLGENASVVLAPRFDWANDGSGWKHSEQSFNLAYSGPVATDLTLHLNLGHRRDRSADERGTTWSVALEHAGFKLGDITVAPMGDLAGDDRSAPWLNLALRATLVEERVWVGTSWARQLDSQHARLATLSLKFAF